MKTFDLIKIELEECIESLMDRSNVYNGIRVHLRVFNNPRTFLVCIKGLEPIEFDASTNFRELADVINYKTLSLNK